MTGAELPLVDQAVRILRTERTRILRKCAATNPKVVNDAFLDEAADLQKQIDRWVETHGAEPF